MDHHTQRSARSFWINTRDKIDLVAEDMKESENIHKCLSWFVAKQNTSIT